MKNVVPKGIVRLILIGGALGVLATTSSSAQESSFNTGYGTKSQKKKKSSMNIALGVGLGFPDMVPFEALVTFSRSLKLRAFMSPTIPFNIIVEMPRDEIENNSGIILEHPPLNIHFDAKYGPQYGLEALYFPGGGSFYFSGGLSFRKLAIEGAISSPLTLKTSVGDAVETNTIFSVGASAQTSQYVGRFSIGFLWNMPGNMYFNLTALGITMPYRAHSNIDVTADITNPKSPTQELNTALQEFKITKEIEMKDKALKQMVPAEELILPVVGLSIGILI